MTSCDPGSPPLGAEVLALVSERLFRQKGGSAAPQAVPGWRESRYCVSPRVSWSGHPSRARGSAQVWLTLSA